MKIIKMKCEHCGATLDVNTELDKIYCDYCGSEILIDDAALELRRIEEVKLHARKQNHEQTIQEQKDFEDLSAVNNFKKGKLSKVLLVFAAICGIVTFSHGFSLAGVIAFTQTALFIFSWLLGMQIIKHKNKKLYLILALIGFMLIIPFFSIGNRTSHESHEKDNFSTNYEKINLDDIYLKDQLFDVKNPNGKIYTNSKNGLYMNLNKVDQKTYESYKKDLTDKGYTIDVEDKTDTWLAYNSEGYKIYLIWYNVDNKLTVDLDSPITMSEIQWPTTGLATKVPKPNSSLGNISLDNSETFGANIGNTTKQDFENYIKACQDAGYVNNHSKSEKRYSATNNDNYKVVIEYHGNNTIYVSVHAPKEEKTNNNSINKEDNKSEEKTSSNNNSSTNNSSNNNSSNNNSNEIRTDFKNAMDSYEKFMDGYISFMKKYNSNPSDTELLKEYSSYMSKYNDMINTYNKWNSKDLNDAETKYYIEVQTRVNKKLTDATLTY